MAENNINNVVDSLMKNMEHLVATKTVIGEVTQVGDAIIVPLVDVSFGVGAGATSNDKRNGGAGGMNAKMSPSAVLVIQNGHAKVVSVKNQDTISKVLDFIPEVIDKIKEKKDGMVDDDEALDAAFPKEEE
ncbi:MAG: GerW family sporulation protein [Lachnospiraceae bacterium]|nr:sporulation protein [Lachnospiraceae bacterium]MBQ8262614.1 GerW family sporulation protein [Lachnospiraceae bacterium]